MPINLKIRKNEADKPKVKEVENGYFIKINDDVFIVKTLERDYQADTDRQEVVLINLSNFGIGLYKNMLELKRGLSNRGSTVEVIRPKQANVNIGFEWREVI